MSVGKIYGSFMSKMMLGTVNLTVDDIYCSLHTGTYTPNQDTHEFQDDLTNEVTGTAYVAGGVLVTNVALTYDAPTNTLMVDCDDPTWTSATISGIRYAVFYDATPGTAATNPLICYMDFLTPQDVSGSNFSVIIPGTGLLTATVA